MVAYPPEPTSSGSPVPLTSQTQSSEGSRYLRLFKPLEPHRWLNKMDESHAILSEEFMEADDDYSTLAI